MVYFNYLGSTLFFSQIIQPGHAVSPLVKSISSVGCPHALLPPSFPAIPTQLCQQAYALLTLPEERQHKQSRAARWVHRALSRIGNHSIKDTVLRGGLESPRDLVKMQMLTHKVWVGA